MEPVDETETGKGRSRKEGDGFKEAYKKGKLRQRFRNGQFLDRLASKKEKKEGVDGWVKELETWRRKPKGEI